MAGKRILVTGASGFIGLHLTRALLETGQHVKAGLRRRVAAIPGDAQLLIGDLSDSINWAALLDGIDVVVHLAAIAHQTDDKTTPYERVNSEATIELARAAAISGSRLIFMSSVAAQSGPSNDQILTEDSPCAPLGRYGNSKRQAEIGIIESGASCVILRPPLVYGTGAKGNMLTLCRLASLPIPLPFGALRNLRSLLSVENLIAAIIFLIEHREISNETFLVADPGPISLPEMITHLRSGMGKPPGLIACPAPLLQAAFQLFGLTKIWERIGGSLVVSADRFNKAGFRPAVSTADGLATMVRRG